MVLDPPYEREILRVSVPSALVVSIMQMLTIRGLRFQGCPIVYVKQRLKAGQHLLTFTNVQPVVVGTYP